MSIKRPPIVVVLGHVDHGKTTLLDYIRQMSVAASRPMAGQEAGGITQSIGAYEIRHQMSEVGSQEKEERRITFIDTPGHEVFSAMRQRGTKVADLGILVVAADESVQNQTKEAFSILQESQTACIVAINKIDRPGIDLNRVKSDLAQAGILLEGFGGTISWQAISAKTGQGVNALIDLVILATDLENLVYDPEAPARGFILESHVDSACGLCAAVIVTDGRLKLGDQITAGGAAAKVKILKNFLGERITEALPSAPVLIAGFFTLPRVGEEFKTGAAEEVISTPAASDQRPPKTAADSDRPAMNVVLKADSGGSLEALAAILSNTPGVREKISIIEMSVGAITDGDVKSALAHRALIIGFRTQPTRTAESLAKIHSVVMIASDIIYELVNEIESRLHDSQPAIVSGDLEVLAVFGKKNGAYQIIGGRVAGGEIHNNAAVAIQRRGQTLGDGKIINLQKNKTDVAAVAAGSECGLLVDSGTEITVGDHLFQK